MGFKFVPPDLCCWHCGRTDVVQQRPPLCAACATEARQRLRDFLARSRALKRHKSGDVRRAHYDPDIIRLTQADEHAVSQVAHRAFQRLVWTA